MKTPAEEVAQLLKKLGEEDPTSSRVDFSFEENRQLLQTAIQQARLDGYLVGVRACDAWAAGYNADEMRKRAWAELGIPEPTSLPPKP